MNILIGSANSYKAIVIAKYIYKNYSEINIYGLVFQKKIIFKSKYFKSIFQIDTDIQDNTIKDLLDILFKKSITKYIPVDSTEYNLIYSCEKLLNHPSLLYLGTKKSYNILNDKALTTKLCVTHSIKTPLTFYNDSNQLQKGTLLKPTNLTSSKGILYIKNEQDKKYAKSQLKNYKSFIIQEYIEGIGVGISVFAKNGKIIASYGHKRLAENPISGGSSVYRTEYKNEEMLGIATKIIKVTDWSGFAMLEFKLTKNNTLFLIEINPRVWGSINQGLVNGTNFFTELIGDTDIKKNNSRILNTYLSPTLFICLFKYALKFNFKPVFIFLKNFKNNDADVSIFRDPLGYLSMIERKLCAKKLM